METIELTLPATQTLTRDVHVGVVASGDLEVLLTPHDRTDPAGESTAEIRLRTTVDGYGVLWERVLHRALADGAYAARYEINDSGATPGMVTLRLAQAAEAARGGAA
ncbi:malonate decarboxylase acyl carrier protein [Gordonia sp. CPCC 205515]|uniref:malonate decarboxylase acyl carrier protein n=1 Tax=Gordonia sp. CPCC 205515 TaxID=3140791 RepID=UPI003AF3C242